MTGVGLLSLAAVRHFDLEHGMARQSGWAHRVAALAALHGAGASVAGTAHAALPVPPTTIGLNVAAPAYFRQTRTFANLLLGGTAWGITGGGHPGPDDVDRDGYLKRLPGGGSVFRVLVQPTASEATIRCTYDGHGEIRSNKGAGEVKPGSYSFHWRNSGYKTSGILLRITSLDPANPIRNLDCRETTLPGSARFAPEFLAMVRPFKVIRFMDWQNTNHNQPVTWATRHTRASIDILDHDGISVEDMVDLVNQVGADPWFNMPWNGDDDYFRHFAQYVHDHVGKDRKVYVEMGNEVWNPFFPMSKQALAEGVSEGLHANPEYARLYRYAERLSHVMQIWSEVFADRPRQLVRVANCQNGPNRAKLVLAYKDTAKHLDALATAPYFGADFRKAPPANLDEAFARLNDGLVGSLDKALLAKGVAASFGKRYIAYEAGQSVVLQDLERNAEIQRDPRMYEAYKRFLSIWREKIGDTLMMYDSVTPVGKSGAWGLLEYLGQPVAEAPKMRAVMEIVGAAQH